jgi:hypothetical protein
MTMESSVVQIGTNYETPEELAHHQDISHLPGKSTTGSHKRPWGSPCHPKQLEQHKLAVHSRRE